jgi:hypothetical protein
MCRRYLRGKCFEPVGAPRNQNKVIAARSEALGIDRANTGRRAGYHRNFPRNSHVTLL